MNRIPDAISVKEAADMIGASEQRVRMLLRHGAIKGKQVGKQWITSEAAVKNYTRATSKKGPPDQPRVSPLPAGPKALSFFSGAMGLDLGLEKSGIHVLLACEMDKACRQTIIKNRPDTGLIGDIWKYSTKQILEYAGLETSDEVDVIVGGPPCQAFSTAGARKGFKDERGNALLRYIEVILEIKPKYAVIENVRGLLSAPLQHTPHSERGKGWLPSREEQKGGALNHVLSLLRAGGYGVSFNLYNAANFGTPQSRERLILLCSRDGTSLPHLMPTHSKDGEFGLPHWRTLRDALEGLDELNCDHESFPEERLRFYRMLGPGQYWKHLPKNLHREALGGSLDAGGGKTGFYRRLAWDKPSCTLVTSPTMPATDICHPEKDRPISVQEYARIQEFPDDWEFCGSLKDKYRQIGNAVPVGLGEAVGKAILAHLKGSPLNPPKDFKYSRYKGTSELDWASFTSARESEKSKKGNPSASKKTSTKTSNKKDLTQGRLDL